MDNIKLGVTQYTSVHYRDDIDHEDTPTGTRALDLELQSLHIV